jgi:hypothetical protein
MRNSAVQFRGPKQVVEAYIVNDMPGWSIWPTARDLSFAYEGNDISEGATLLRQLINRLREGGSEAAYTLKVYDDVKKGAKITTVTPASRSFQFGLYEMEGDDTPYQKRQNSTVGAIERRFQEMQDQFMSKVLKKMDEDDKAAAEPEKPQGLAGMLHGVLDLPGVKEALAAKVMGWLSSVIPVKPAPAQVAGIEGELPKVSPDQYAKLEEAINILATCDPEIGDHLLALALMARDNPKKYKMALTFL